MRQTKITRRGWAALTLAAMLFGFTLGMTSAMGDEPCEWAVHTGLACP